MNLYGYEFQRETDLAHYGIIGMKWGVRRYQNADGTLTNAGRKHYGYNANNKSNGSSKNFSKKESKKVLKKVEQFSEKYQFDDSDLYKKYKERLFKANKIMATDPRYWSENSKEFEKAVNEHMKPIVDKYVAAYRRAILKDMGYSTSKESIKAFNDYLEKHKRSYLTIPVYGEIGSWVG